MKKILAPLLFTLMAFAPASIELQTLALLDKVTVGLPGKASDDDSKGIPMKKVVMDDGTEFNAFTMDYTTFGMTEEMLRSMAGTEGFKDQMEGMIASQKGMKLVKNETGKYNEKYTCYDMVLDVDNNEYKGIMYQKMIFYKQYSISLLYRPGKNGMNEGLKNQVFNSLKIAE